MSLEEATCQVDSLLEVHGKCKESSFSCEWFQLLDYRLGGQISQLPQLDINILRENEKLVLILHYSLQVHVNAKRIVQFNRLDVLLSHGIVTEDEFLCPHVLRVMEVRDVALAAAFVARHNRLTMNGLHLLRFSLKGVLRLLHNLLLVRWSLVEFSLY